MKCDRCPSDAVYVMNDIFSYATYCRRCIKVFIQDGGYDYLYKYVIGIITKDAKQYTATKITEQERWEMGRLYHKSLITGVSAEENNKLIELMEMAL